MIGQTISHYRITEKLGEGGMGIVYIAEDTYLGRQVAIKTISPASDGSHFRSRFLREARAISALSHPNIATIYDYGETDDGRAFIVMELIKGQTLGDILEEGELSLAEGLRIIESVAEALSAAHSQGIVHRDIKPSNVMVNDKGQVKVLDFGLAKQINDEASSATDPDAQTLLATRTQSGVVVGTPLYLSPEQATGQAVDARSDLFALGALLYECVTGRAAFSGASVLEIGAQVIHVNPELPSRVNGRVPEELDRVVMKAMAKKVGERYQSAEEMLRELREVEGGLSEEDKHRTLRMPAKRLGTKAPPFPRPRRSSAMQALSGAFATLSQTLQRPRVSLVTMSVAVGLIGLLVWGIVAWLRPGLHKPKPEAQRMYEVGTGALRDGAYYQASKALEQAVKIDDRFALAHASLAEAWTELDYTDKAKDELLRLNTLIPDQSALSPVDALYLDAIRATVTRNFPRAIEAYQQILKLTPDDAPNKAQVYVDLGRAYEKNEEMGKAIESYTEATARDRQYATAYLRLGILYGRKQDMASALAHFDKAYEMYQTLGTIEGRAEVHYQRGLLYNSIGKLADARSELQQALNLAQTTDNKYQQIKARLQLSSVSFAENDSKQAEQHAQEAIDLAQAGGMETLTAQGLIDLGNVYLVRGEYQDADKYFRQALEFAQRYKARRNEARAQLALGSLRMQQGNTDEAISYVEQALPFYQQGGYSKNVSLGLNILARASRRKGDYTGALERYQQLLELAHKVGDLNQEASTQEALGLTLMKLERYTEALEHFDAGLAINKNLKAQLNIGYNLQSRGEALWRLGRYDEARAALSEAASIAEQPSGGSKELRADIQRFFAEMALSQRQFAEARTRAEQALALAGTQFADSATEAKRVQGLAQALSGAAREGQRLCAEVVERATRSGDPWLLSEAQLALAEATLENRDAQGARAPAQQALESFVRSGQVDSEWRARLALARASRLAGDDSTAQEQASRASESLSSLQQKWGAESYNSYLTRPDVQAYRKQLEEVSTLKR
jgi:serine/threonine protein kinase/Tfp pilus assembly protein PilF